MVDPTRLELVTSSMSRKRSNQLSYGSEKKFCVISPRVFHAWGFVCLANKANSMGKEGVEPSRPFGHRILSPACIPFHHLPSFVER